MTPIRKLEISLTASQAYEIASSKEKEKEITTLLNALENISKAALEGQYRVDVGADWNEWQLLQLTNLGYRVEGSTILWDKKA
jgi:hypothetical protein